MQSPKGAGKIAASSTSYKRECPDASSLERGQHRYRVTFDMKLITALADRDVWNVVNNLRGFDPQPKK